jgi:hypothetical protein
MRKNKIVLTILLVFISLIINAQNKETPDFIINLKNDTIIGEIKEKNKSTISFVPLNSTSETLYTVEQLLGYSIEKIPRIIAAFSSGTESKKYFVKVRVKGYCSLMELIKADTTFLFLIQLPNQDFMPLPQNNESWAVLRSNLLACETTYFENTLLQKSYSYTLAYFSKVIRAYNECVKPELKETIYKSPVSFSYGFSSSYASNNWVYTFDDGKNQFFNANGNLTSYSRIVFGLFFNLMSEKRLSYNIELIYNQYRGDRITPIINNGVKVNDYKVSVEQQYLSIPLQGKYVVFSPPKSRIYVKGGVLLNFDLQFDLYRELVGIAPNTDNFIIRKSLGFGYSTGFGIEREVGRNKKLFSEIRYLSHGVRDGATQIGNTNSLQVVLGFGFTKK